MLLNVNMANDLHMVASIRMQMFEINISHVTALIDSHYALPFTIYFLLPCHFSDDA